jgi:hypothetical protein
MIELKEKGQNEKKNTKNGWHSRFLVKNTLRSFILKK